MYEKSGAVYEKYATLRDAKGFKDVDVANATGIFQSTFSDWKKGRSTPKLAKLLKLAKFFEVPVEEFLKR